MKGIDTFKSKFVEDQTIQIPEFKPTGKVNPVELKLQFTVRKRKKNTRIFNFLWDWYKSKGD